MPIGVPTSAPSSRPNRASETVASRCRQISPLANNVRSLSPIRLGRLLQNSLNRWPAENSQISNKPTTRTRRQIKAEPSMPSRAGLPGARISSAMTGSVIGAFGSRQVAKGDDVLVGEFLHGRVGHPQHLQRGFESGLLRVPVMRQAALGRILGNRHDEVRRQCRKPFVDRGLYRLGIGLNDLL